MSQRTSTQRRTWKERALSLLLAAALVAGLAPGLTLPASAAHWADAYLDQLVDQGILRADQTADPDAELSRAEFMAIINRAYGYTETGPIPFTDVLPTDWFYDDISIAYTAGYMAGTSATTASPNDTLTREQAFCILGRNMMMKETPGESLAFADSRDISDWARGTIKTAVDNYVVSGYPDNTLHPQASISKGQMATLVTQCLGVPIQESGTYELGGVFGNVTITAPDVTLRNTTISGDLYISGGVGLGGIKLENVDVLGRIIVSGTGESEGGDASVIMRNVTANEMLVDNMQNKTVTIRADGITDIAKTLVRTNAYLEDNNTDDKGLMRIELAGGPGLRLTLAGRIKEVVNKTSGSNIQLAKGTLAKLTIDEAATGSIVQIDRNTKVAELNLDVATNVLGDGDIGQLNVNAPGSVVSMLPDNIYVRPGLNASIAGVIMDYQTAQEGSLDPRLLSGYPAAKDIAPTGFRADFAGNKKGTVYWAVSYVSDGSIGEEDLISPPSYGNKAIVNGSVEAPTGGDEVSAQVSNLVVGGAYYLSAVLVDEQKERSPVKVISFSTPDNTVPAFAQGYPYMSRTTRAVAQVTVMPSKSCKLYYALLPQGAKAPTANEMKAAAVSGNLGYGVRDVTKNTEDAFTVNSQRLEELKNYVLYLWLTDADGANSSAVQSLQFGIPDETPPEFVVHPHMNGNPLATSIPMAVTVNEDATVFWAVVPEGANYPLPNNNSTNPTDNVSDPDSGQVLYSEYHTDFAKLCVTSGMGALQRGQVAARANTEVTFNVTGLAAETAYDFYYVARDTAGVYSVQVYKLQGGLHTLDNSGPVVVQKFNPAPSDEAPNNPLASADIVLEFTENIRSDTTHYDKDFLTLYSESKTDPTAFVQTLAASIVLYHLDPESQVGEPVPVWGSWGSDEPEPMHWVNYNNVTIRLIDEGHVRVTFPGTGTVDNPSKAAVKLGNGEQYYFQFQHIVDTATPTANPLGQADNEGLNYSTKAAREEHVIPVFTTVFSQVLMRNQAPSELPVWKGTDESGRTEETNGTATTYYARADMTFRLSPQSTKNTDASNKFDILIYLLDSNAKFDLYYRITDKSGKGIRAEGAAGETIDPEAAKYKDNLLTDYAPEKNDPNGLPDANGWYFLGSSRELFSDAATEVVDGVSVGLDFNGCQNSNTTRPFPSLQNFSEDLYYEFVISITKNGEQTQYESFSNTLTFDIYLEAGQTGSIFSLAGTPGERQSYEDRGLGQDYGVSNIGMNPQTGGKHLELTKSFTNTKAPVFVQGAPWYRDSDSTEAERLYVYENPNDPKMKTALVGDSYAYLTVNMDLKGTIYYAVSARNAIQPTLVKDTEEANGTITTTPIPADDVWDMVPTDGFDDRNGAALAGQLPEGVRVTYPALSQLTQSGALANAIIKKSEPFADAMIPQTIELTGMKADTEYYIYFVLESERRGTAPGARTENVLVYKFKTAKTSAPRIKLDSPGTGSITVDTSWGDVVNNRSVEADLTWRIAPRQTAYNILVGRTFTFTDAPSKVVEYFTGAENTRGLQDEYGNEIGGPGVDTWYEALSIEYTASAIYSSAELRNAEFGSSYDGYTLFDLFASTSDKFTLQGYVEGRQSMGSVNNDRASTRRTNNQETNYLTNVEWFKGPNQNIDDPTTGTYLFLIAGHNINSSTPANGDWSTVNSFRIADNVEYVNRDAPELTNLNTLKGVVMVDKATNLIHVDFNLQFNKELYWRRGNKFYKVVTSPATLEPTDKTATEDAMVGMLYGLTPSTLANATVEGSSQLYSFNFDGIDPARPMTQIVILGADNGAIAANEGNSASPIVVTVYCEEIEKNGKSYWRVSGDVSYNNGKQSFSLLGGDYEIPVAKVPTPTAEISTITGSGSYNFDVKLTFDDTPYIKSSTGDWDPLRDISKDATQSGLSATVGARDKTKISTSHTVTVGGASILGGDSTMGTITLLSTSDICDASGEASTTNKIRITVEKVDPPEGGIVKVAKVTVYFGTTVLDTKTQSIATASRLR